MLEKTILPDVLIQIISWVLGEYGYMAQDIALESIIQRLCDVSERKLEGISSVSIPDSFSKN